MDNKNTNMMIVSKFGNVIKLMEISQMRKQHNIMTMSKLSYKMQLKTLSKWYGAS